ncbi:MAG: hypothetical protein IT164_03570 [Bryobacterales bacterium]|nr:hypothetical protein [Bryobacterales bacterium]
MPLALLVRITPAGPWRNGPHTGSRDRVDPVCHSDTLFAALTGALNQLDEAGPWLEATARAAEPAVRLTSLFPYLRDDLYVPPPRTLWPPQLSGRLRASGARFVPTRVVASLLNGPPLREDSWEVDGMSQCLVPRSGRPGHAGPFRYALRAAAAVDRLTGAAAPHRTACLEFAPNAGYWCAAVFAGAEAAATWRPKLEAAFRLLSDTGLGGERSRGWGHAAAIRFQFGDLASLLLPGAQPAPETSRHWWLLSLCHASASDAIDWTAGNYSLAPRAGRTVTGALKPAIGMIAEGSVLASASAPVGQAADVTPAGHPHPVYRSGFAVALPLPGQTHPHPSAPFIAQEPLPAAEPLSAAEPAPAPEPASEPLPDTEPEPELVPAFFDTEPAR